MKNGGIIKNQPASYNLKTNETVFIILKIKLGFKQAA
jgi:hypothetical protein